jgi:hypothetical protein
MEIGEPVCLAISDDQVYICTNGGHSPSMYTRYVNMATGAVERRLSSAVFTTHWRIEIVSPDRQPLVLINFHPLRQLIRVTDKIRATDLSYQEIDGYSL